LYLEPSGFHPVALRALWLSPCCQVHAEYICTGLSFRCYI